MWRGRLTQGSQSLALGLTLTAASQLVSMIISMDCHSFAAGCSLARLKQMGEV
jgi:hypothetical protein